FTNYFVDAMDLAILLMPSLKGHRQEDLTRLWSIKCSTRHRAFEDAQTLTEVFDNLLNGLYNAPIGLLKVLVDHSPVHKGGLSFLLSTILDERTGGRPVRGIELERAIPVDKTWASISPLTGECETFRAVESNDIRDFFSSDGKLANEFAEYEEREEQVEMALAVRDTLEEGGMLLVEAGTGTGKSLAYLLPAVFHSRETGFPVVVSTKTLNLQDQLFTRDLPLLSSALGEGYFRFTVLKGYSNYVCLRKLEALLDGRRGFNESHFGIIGMLLTWISEGNNGDISLLNVSNLRGLEFQVVADWRDCAGDHCKFGKENLCFYKRALFKARRANIVVVNHSLLLTGVNLPFESLIIDEAHTLEDVATEQFTLTVDYSGTKRFLEFLFNPDEGEGFLKNQVEFLDKVLEKKVHQRFSSIMRKSREDAAKALGALDDLFLSLCNFYWGNDEYEAVDIRLTSERLSSEEGEDLIHQAGVFKEILVSISEKLSRSKDVLRSGSGADIKEVENVMLSLDGMVSRLIEIVSAIDAILLNASNEERVSWATVADVEKMRTQVLKSSPIHIGSELYELLYSQLRSIVMTSATLVVGDSFDFFCSRVGVDLVDSELVRKFVLSSSFDFKKQMHVLLLADMPHPNSTEYAGKIADVLAQAIRASHGGALVLFTNRRLMIDTYEKISDALLKEGLPVFCQRQSYSRRRITEKFIEDDAASLFGAASFWEGVDARGDTLRLVIVTRIPFESPGKPVFEARCERLEKEGISNFMNLSLPLAALRLKQGVGRLIRTGNDRGQVLILDSRIATERYGRILLRSLPPCSILSVGLDEFARILQSFA
ncbi:MAG: helicase C-terminal domain-containing protein, partial [Actinomycetota bacterium]|nr:helicase C-terminal domain-containing protein [Actinomycetota bacterium]